MLIAWKSNMLPKNQSDKPIAKHLLMKLIGSRKGMKMNAASAVRVGALFGISENNIRVTLNRLQSANLLQLVERGYYKLGKEGERFAEEISHWRIAEDMLCEWYGDWVTVLTNSLVKSDRKAQRKRQRALKLMGMRKLSADFYIRPNNFADGIDSVRLRLHGLGLDKNAMVFVASHLPPSLHQKAITLWHGDALEISYEQGIAMIEQSLQQLPDYSLSQAAKVSYLVGDNALQHLVFDPLLPEPLVNVSLRKTFREKVIAYDKAGADIWYEFLHIDD